MPLEFENEYHQPKYYLHLNVLRTDGLEMCEADSYIVFTIISFN